MGFDTWHNMLGLLGVVMVLITYGMIATGRWRATQYRYPLANLIGTMLIAISLIYAFNWPSFIMQIFMIGISFMGIARIYKAAKKGEAASDGPDSSPAVTPENAEGGR